MDTVCLYDRYVRDFLKILLSHFSPYPRIMNNDVFFTISQFKMKEH